jgi:hypothetical protein
MYAFLHSIHFVLKSVKIEIENKLKYESKDGSILYLLSGSQNFGSRNLLGQLDAPRTQNFEIQVPKGSHLREVFALRP